MLLGFANIVMVLLGFLLPKVTDNTTETSKGKNPLKKLR